MDELKPPPMSDVDRAEFETFVKAELGDIAVFDNGRYISPKIANYWKLWQHRSALVGELQRDAERLTEALQELLTAQAMTTSGDSSDFVWPTQTMRKPGETAWGWICEKHGLGYTGGCLCCRDEFDRYKNQKDTEARYAREDALKAASKKARTAIAARGEKGGV